MTLSPERMKEVYKIQVELQQKVRDVPEEGKVIDYEGKKFIVYQGVFWPHEDSKALVRNFEILPGEEVADICTGSGVIAIHAALKGARRVVALDINPNACRATDYNARQYRIDDIVESRVSDVFSALKPGEQFDVITMNPPFTDHQEEQGDYAEKTIWDAGFHVHTCFFEELDVRLKSQPNARAYTTQANFGSIERMLEMADQAGYSVRQIGQNRCDELRTFYAFELKRKK